MRNTHPAPRRVRTSFLRWGDGFRGPNRYQYRELRGHAIADFPGLRASRVA